VLSGRCCIGLDNGLEWAFGIQLVCMDGICVSDFKASQFLGVRGIFEYVSFHGMGRNLWRASMAGICMSMIAYNVWI
jgi:hypothetical protein